MEYFIYENWRAKDKTKIHISECSFCNNGTGTGRNTNNEKNGKWHGPFHDLKLAQNFAVKLGRKENSLCRCCY